MRKKIIILFTVTCLAIALGAVNALAGDYLDMVGTTSFGAAGSTISSNLSTNVFCNYLGGQQSYLAACHNKAGDKVYGTGGGQGVPSGIYYKQDTAFIGQADCPEMRSGSWNTADGWTAQ